MGRVLLAEEPNLAGFLLTDHTGQVGRAKAGIETAHLRAGLTEDGVLACNRQVAHDVQHVTTANGIAVDHGYDGFG